MLANLILFVAIQCPQGEGAALAVVPEAVVPEAVVPEAVVPEAVIAQPVIAQPVIAQPVIAQPVGGDKALKALKKWFVAYRKGKLDIGNWFENINNKSFAKKAGLTKGKFETDRGAWKKGEFSRRHEIILLADEVSKLNSGPAAELILQLAAVGIDRVYKYTSAMAPMLIQQLGEENIGKFNSVAARSYFLKAAKGEPVGPPKIKSALQAAALKTLARFEEAEYIPVMVEGVKSIDPIVRAHAVDGIKMLSPRNALQPISVAFEKETSEVAQVAMIQCIESIYFRNEGKVDTAAMVKAQRRAAACLQKGAWQTDIAMIEFLHKFPHADAVPILIDILVRFVEHPEDIDSGKISGLLRYKAYEAVQAMTGSFYQIDDAEKWKQFWARVKDGFEILKKDKKLEELQKEWDAKESKRKADQKKVGGKNKIKTVKRKSTVGTVNNDFFGIKIQGSRIVIVLDVSGSMGLPMQFTKKANQDKKWRNGVNRLEVAKEEVRKTVELLTPDVKFNIVTYDDKVKVWQKKLVPATDKNKKLVGKFLRKLSPSMNTNLYDGVDMALKMKSLVYGDRYDSNVDEIFVLSDGVPNRGAVRNDFDILVTLTKTNRFSKVRINTVFTGMVDDKADPNETGMKLMKNLAAQNGGKFIRP